MQPQQMYFTSTGRISVVLDVDEALSLKLSALQRNIAGCIKGSGNIDHAAYVLIPPTHIFVLTYIDQMESTEEF